ncbi:MAG TPA: RagB/SusD family nutrient uptake outer membrane protein, partial [Bacteroidales bacterium]
LIFLQAGCAKDFLVKPPLDSVTDASFYQNDAQLQAATALLYSQVWFDYNDKASYNFGDFRAGTAYSAYNDRNNVLFNTTPDIGEVSAAWRAFFIVVGQSNLAIHNINTYAGSGVTETAKKHAIAEARFMRALAYRYLVMDFGPVPIITDNLTLLNDTSLTRNTIQSVWRFIISEMRAVANDLPETPDLVGRVTKWSAEGMLARFYLTRAGVESVGGVRNQTYLDSAKYYADRVIKLSGKQLLTDYASLFHYPYDNNSESLFELQWVWIKRTSTVGYGQGNSAPSYLTFSNDITSNGDGWGGDKSATWWMLSLYDGIASNGDAVADTSMKGNSPDTRLKATFMLPGMVYPEITQTLNGVNQQLKFPLTDDDGRNFASIKKYVCGQKVDLGGQGDQQDYPQDTYMLRLAEMYLTYAEATLGNNATTNDVTALSYFNAVHTRAGLPPVTVALTPDTIFKERIKEFAMEGMAWYDLVSLHYYNPQKTYTIINSQDRGVFNVKPDNFNNPTIWTFQKSPHYRSDVRKVNAYDGNFLIPLPAAEVLQAPNLLKEPVDYYSK